MGSVSHRRADRWVFFCCFFLLWRVNVTGNDFLLQRATAESLQLRPLNTTTHRPHYTTCNYSLGFNASSSFGERWNNGRRAEELTEAGEFKPGTTSPPFLYPVTLGAYDAGPIKQTCHKNNIQKFLKLQLSHSRFYEVESVRQ